MNDMLDIRSAIRNGVAARFELPYSTGEISVPQLVKHQGVDVTYGSRFDLESTCEQCESEFLQQMKSIYDRALRQAQISRNVVVGLCLSVL